MDIKHKNSDVTKSQTRESNTKESSKARASLLDAIEVANASGLPYKLFVPIRLDDNDGQELTMIVF